MVVVMVMGHTACGGERTSKNCGFVDLVAKKNMELPVADIRQRSPVRAELEANGGIETIGAMCRQAPCAGSTPVPSTSTVGAARPQR